MSKTDSQKKMGNGAKIAAIILAIIIFIGIPLGIVWWMQTENQKMLDRGCTGSGASDIYGNPTYWTCPIK